MENTHIFTQVSLVIVLAAVVSLIMRLLKQPLIMGYILTGILVGPSVFNMIGDTHTFEVFAELGIALLLFIVGLGLNAAIIRSVGKVAFLTALGTLVGIGMLGFGVSRMFGFSIPEALIIGIGLFFSSTIIILKVLGDKKELGRLYGQIAVGVILIEDVVATLALVAVAAFSTGDITAGAAVDLLTKGLGLGALLTGAALYVLPRLTKVFAGNQELLFLFTVAWGFGIASLFDYVGFSMEVGALFAGVAMATLPYATEMGARLKPLRDFFLILFFIMLGSSFSFDGISANLIPAAILSAIVIIGKPFIIMTTLGVLGYTKLTGFKAGIHLSQISEFSIILTVFAYSVGVIDERVTTLVTLIALITIAVSTYLMKYDDALYRLWERQLRMFESRAPTEHTRPAELYPLILFGYQKGGHEFVRAFRDLKKRYVVVDYDPEVIEHMEHQGIRHAFGDATDPEFLEEIGVPQASLIVSTITDEDANQTLLEYVRHHNKEAVFICHADSYDNAARYYALGASYVMLPHFLGSERIGSFIRKNGLSSQAFDHYRAKHLVNLGKQALK